MDTVTKWHEEADVIIVGYGLAGGVAAIEASNHGAEVIILDKSEYPGGCSILSGGMILSARSADDAEKYLKVTQGGRVDESLIRPFAEGLAGIEDYVKELAEPFNGIVKNTQTTEPGKVKETGYIPLGYEFPGFETFYRTGVSRVPGFKDFPWVQKLAPAGINIMKVVFDSVENRKIRIMLSTPGEKLVTDAAGAVIGVIARKDGKEIALKARRGVIIASGGFEQSEWMLKQFTQGMPMYSMAPLTHTGDGIRMAQKVGAALWHMWHIHGSYGFKYDGFPIAFRTSFGGPRQPKRTMPWIAVDKYGRRYMNEYPPAPQDTAHRAMELWDADMPGYSRIPSYLIYDEAGRKHGPIGQPLAIGGYRYDWSRDNLQEVEKGWIMKADSLKELASRIQKTRDNESRMDADILADSVAAWNEVVEKGRDPFGRPAGTMIPIGTPPFYAAEVWPIISNTQGGAQHNVKQQIVDPFGEPIPRLYGAGEVTSFWAHVYLLAGNLGECLISGRVAGTSAAAEPPLK